MQNIKKYYWHIRYIFLFYARGMRPFFCFFKNIPLSGDIKDGWGIIEFLDSKNQLSSP